MPFVLIRNHLSQIWLPAMVILMLSACGKESIKVKYERIESNSDHLITNIEAYQDQLIFMSGDYWLIGEMGISQDGKHFVTDSFSNKIVLDFVITDNEDLITAGIDANIHYRPKDGNWSFKRLSEYGILKGITATADGFLAVGGQAQRLGWIYRIDHDFNITQIHEFNHELTGIAHVSEDIFVAVGYGIILRSDNAGESWKVNNQEGDYYTEVLFPTPERGYIIGDRGGFLISEDKGVQWDEISSGNSTLGSNPRYRNIYFENDQNGYIVGDNGTYWQTEDAGSNWLEYNLNINENLYDCVVFNSSLYLAGVDGFIGRVDQ